MLSEASLMSRKIIQWISFHMVENGDLYVFPRSLEIKDLSYSCHVYKKTVNLLPGTDVGNAVLCGTLQHSWFMYELQVMNASSLC